MDTTNLHTLLDFAVLNHASDLHLSAGLSPLFRIEGELKSFHFSILNNINITDMLKTVMTSNQYHDYQCNHDIDFSFELSNIIRIRANAYRQTRGAAATFRMIPLQIPSLQDLNLPPVFEKIASLPHGLVLITGPTGSGKSTTLAAIIDYINTTCHQHIITLEDPIEFIHQSKSCLINQREIFLDTQGVATALRAALRQDPDVILVGELRDLETIRLAITAAETGHLVLATLHARSASQAINRLIDLFPGNEKTIIRTQLSESLQAVVAQTLLKQCEGGRVGAFEIMICTPAIRHLIREGKINQLYSILQMGKMAGMQTLDQDLMRLVAEKRITVETALEVAVDKSL